MSEHYFSYPNTDFGEGDTPEKPAPAQAPEAGVVFSYEAEPQLPQGAPEHELPAGVRELREQDSERRMYSAQTMYAEHLQEPPGAGEDVRAFLAESREIYCDLGLASHEAKLVSETFSTVLNSGELPDQGTRDAWQREATAAVYARYGPKEAPQRIAEARALVARDPRIHDLLDRSGLGSHPKIVQLLIEKARTERGRGRLR